MSDGIDFGDSASSRESQVSTGRTGPKISSCMTAIGEGYVVHQRRCNLQLFRQGRAATDDLGVIHRVPEAGENAFR